MIEHIKFTNVDGETLLFNESNDTSYPTNNMTTEVDARFSEKPKSQQHGIYPSNTFWGKRLIHIEGDLLAQTAAEYVTKRMTMMSVLMPRPQYGQAKAGDLEILFTGMGEPLSCEATLDGYPELPLQALSPSRTPYQINFKTFDPRFYGSLNTTRLYYGVSDNIGGRTYNKTYDKTYAASTLGTNSSILNVSGNYDSPPILTIHGYVVDPMITMVRATDGQAFFFKLQGLTLTDTSDYAVVDFSKRTVVRGTGANLYNYSVGSDWFTVEPKSLVIFSGSAGTNGISYCDFQWRNAYMF